MLYVLYRMVESNPILLREVSRSDDWNYMNNLKGFLNATTEYNHYISTVPNENI